MYFWYEMDVQRLCLVSNVHPIFVAKAYAEDGRYLRPHPPHFFGRAILSQLIHTKTHLS